MVLKVPTFTSVPIAEDVEFDNSTNGFNSTDTQSAIEEASKGSITGPNQGFLYSKDGSVTVGTYLRTGTVATNLAGQPIRGLCKSIIIKATVSSNVSSTTRIQFVRRTAISTFADITGLYVDIPSGSFTSSRTIEVDIGPDWEIGCYNKSGSTLSNAICVLYVVPQ